jgi:protein-S-isoprenylcysteine O-methyltransferase Ste14
MSAPLAVPVAISRPLPRVTPGNALKFLVQRRVRVTAIVGIAIIPLHLCIGGGPPRDLIAADMITACGWSLLLAGLTLRSWAAGVLSKQRELATSGPYALSRNPLYAGSCLLMAGFLLFMNAAPIFLFAACFFALLYLMVIRNEERRLSRLFPEAWPAYTRSVPPLIPARLVSSGNATWSFRRWWENEEQRACLGTAIALIGLKVWQVCS